MVDVYTCTAIVENIISNPPATCIYTAVFYSIMLFNLVWFDKSENLFENCVLSRPSQ